MKKWMYLMSKTIDDKKFFVKPGKIRPSQLISTFGPGSIINFSNDSILVKGIDFWANRDNYIQKNHIYLQKITKKSKFMMPYVSDKDSISISCKSFPQWGYCSLTKCQLLQRHKPSPEKHNDRGTFFCKKHSWIPLLPARLVMTCKQGHLDEFPWVEWAHGSHTDPRKICTDGELYWKGGRNSTSLGDYSVECSCGAKNSMYGSTTPQGIKIYYPDGSSEIKKCSGQKPWLDSEEECKMNDGNTEIPIGALSRSTSLYYSKLIRGLIIPRLCHPIIKYLQSDSFEEINKLSMFKKLSYEEKAQELLDSNSMWTEKNYSVKDILFYMDLITERPGVEQNIQTELELKEIEYEDLKLHKTFDDDDVNKDLVIEDVKLNPDEKKYFQDVRRLTLLTILEVQRYFSRLTPPGDVPTGSKTEFNKIISKLEVDGTTIAGRKYGKNDWLPANIKKGEGIFIVFNNDFFKKFSNDFVNSRLKSMIKNKKDFDAKSDWPSDDYVDEKYIFLHSISHLLIKQLARKSGYDEASISERIYSSETMNGILIYTSSNGTGSMGGLVRQTDDGILNILLDALENHKDCSRDPICLNTEPSEMASVGVPLHLRQNGSVCFACLMLPETSCEYFNKMLDRKILVDIDNGLKSYLNHE
jgi:hypothetical protein